MGTHRVRFSILLALLLSVCSADDGRRGQIAAINLEKLNRREGREERRKEGRRKGRKERRIKPNSGHHLSASARLALDAVIG